MPGIARDIEALIENRLAEFGLAAGSRIWTAALIGAARIEAEFEKVVRRLRFQDDGINARFKRARVFGGQRLLDGFPADAGGIEFGHVKMVAQKITRAAAVGRPRGYGEADQARATVMEIAMLRGGTGGRAARVMKSGSDDSFFFTRANNLIHGLGPSGERNIRGCFHVATGRFVVLRSERWQVFVVHGSEAGEPFGFGDGHFKRPVVEGIRARCAALF